ncbi:hypothetical protein D8B26_008196 [Coccidioides posadasii str. Silveira]|uniref:uncharacterized protein n=1 Tax=Coccidioides posadasii (strain RMSCC 757 / Silveira) TaxID=443226 RepID=UPI001BEE0DFF|nr:hypothetical protein D8B26_008196 [Coccidioides posadasii str. Silveira]
MQENPPSIKSRRVKTVSKGQLIVTIDFGTTYTSNANHHFEMFTDRRQGVSHVFSAKSPSTVAQLMNSPGTWDYREKVPTIIAVAGDNGNRETLWGAEVKTGISSSAWFKIGMAPKLCATLKMIHYCNKRSARV